MLKDTFVNFSLGVKIFIGLAPDAVKNHTNHDQHVESPWRRKFGCCCNAALFDSSFFKALLKWMLFHLVCGHTGHQFGFNRKNPCLGKNAGLVFQLIGKLSPTMVVVVVCYIEVVSCRGGLDR